MILEYDSCAYINPKEFKYDTDNMSVHVNHCVVIFFSC